MLEHASKCFLCDGQIVQIRMWLISAFDSVRHSSVCLGGFIVIYGT